MNKLTDGIKHLIIINVILFVAPQLLQLDFTNMLALHFPENEHFGFWQYITHMFMHASFSHILFNMYGLWAVWNSFRANVGKKKILILLLFCWYLVQELIYTLVNYYQFNAALETLVTSGISQNEILELMNPTKMYQNKDLQTMNQLYNTPAVGASGAVYGVLAAFGLYFKDAKLALIFLPIPIAAKYFIPVMIFGDLFFGMTKYSVGNIAHFAHIGGALIGFIIAYSWKKNQFKTT